MKAFVIILLTVIGFLLYNIFVGNSYQSPPSCADADGMCTPPNVQLPENWTCEGANSALMPDPSLCDDYTPTGGDGRVLLYATFGGIGFIILILAILSRKR